MIKAKRLMILLPLATLMLKGNSAASQQYATNLNDTTLRYNIEKASVISTPKETYQLKQLPASTSIIEHDYLSVSGTRSIKGLSYRIPNLYIPSYGSKITSAVYIRGIGSRFSPSPSIGLYSDNVPYLDKSAFDFEFLDIERVEILRGPQGTLYGRNALGGIIHVRSRSPFAKPQTKIELTGGTYGQLKGAFSTNHYLGDNAAFSLSAFYSRHDGFFYNSHTEKKVDDGDNLGGKLRFNLKLAPRWMMEIGSHIESTNQNAYPYGEYNPQTGRTSTPSYNDTSSYKRILSTNSLQFTHNAPGWKLSLISSYQYLDDQMRLDQDFSPASIYTMYQKQNQHNLSQEAIFKSENNKNYQFVSGLSMFYQDNETEAPVTFGQDGMQRFFQQTFDMLYQSGQMPLKMTVQDQSMLVSGLFSQNSYGLALFHQTTLQRVFTDGLSLTLGLRYEYEEQKLDYLSAATLNLSFNRPPAPMPIPVSIPAQITGNSNQNFGVFLPKIALKYSFGKTGKIFLTSARGYKAGGYNIQMFSDLIQASFMSGMPGSGNSQPEEENGVSQTISYKPEFNWNNEIGYSGELVPGKLSLNGAVFYIQSRDQQIVQFAGSTGFGRIARNAAKSYSTGCELGLEFNPVKSVQTTLNWGHTYSKFTDYSDGRQDYTGNFVPFVPRNTVSATIKYHKEINLSWLNGISTFLQYTGAGKIFWTEDNSVSQDFYSVLDGSVSFYFPNFELSLWLKNMTDVKYNTFYFETLGKGVAQLNNPFNTGMTIRFGF
jgi:outer membrane receptor protein involved in Fe transport